MSAWNPIQKHSAPLEIDLTLKFSGKLNLKPCLIILRIWKRFYMEVNLYGSEWLTALCLMYARIGTKSYTFASQFQVKQQNKGAFINYVDNICFHKRPPTRLHTHICKCAYRWHFQYPWQPRLVNVVCEWPQTGFQLTRPEDRDKNLIKPAQAYTNQLNKTS